MNARFRAVADDPRIIPGVHHHCDEWCDYCPVTHRCLVFRCTTEFRKQHARAVGEPTFQTIDEAIAFTRAIAEIEGTSTVELDALTAADGRPTGMQTTDPLAGIAHDYAIRVATGFAPIAEMVATAPVRPEGPDPAEVALWYHVRIYLRLVRALVAREGKVPRPDATEDAIGSAKLVLVAIRQSRAAFRRMQAEVSRDGFADELSMLDALEHGVNERFPAAREFVRVGLDVPVA